MPRGVKRSKNIVEIHPQPGPQTAFLTCKADIAITGGAGFGGKTFGLLMDPLRFISVRGFGSVMFRRTTPQIRGEGGMWDTSMELYPHCGGVPREVELEWRFPPHGCKIKFAHMEHERNRYDWDSTQIPVIGFDQLESFTAPQFWHLIGRNRTGCGVRPYVRATCNPVPDGWLRELVDWWIGKDGYAIQARSGVVRWLLRSGDDLLWGDTPEEVIRIAVEDRGMPTRDLMPKSLTFIPALPDDNKIGLEKDPGYIGNLMLLPKVERERLRYGNWNVRPAAGDYFQRIWCELLPNEPAQVVRWVRSWDLAGTRVTSASPDPDWSVGVKLGLMADKSVVISDVVRRRDTPGQIEALILRTADFDGRGVRIHLSQDPGQAGKAQSEALVRALRGFHTTVSRETGPKETRAGPFSSAAEHGLIRVVRGPWNEPYLTELENFPKGGHDDDMDSTANGFNVLSGRGGNFRLMAPGGDVPRGRPGLFRQTRLG